MYSIVYTDISVLFVYGPDPTRRRIQYMSLNTILYYTYIVYYMYYVSDVLQQHRYIHYTISFVSVFVAYATRVNRHVLYILLSMLL